MAKFSKRKYTVWLALAIIIFLDIQPVLTGHKQAAAAWLPPPPPVEAPGKDEVGVNDDDDVNRSIQKANVLFFLDTSHPMMLEPRGSMPYVVMGNNGQINNAATLTNFGYTAAQAIDMMKYVTFGVGTVPPADSYYNAPVVNFNNFGRDTDDTNNLGYNGGSTDINAPENLYRYYSPYNQSGHTLRNTFAKQNDLYYANANNNGSGWAYNVNMPLTYRHNYDYKTAVNDGNALPYMLVFKNPLYWKTGMTGFNPNNAAHREELVPNDSRMYQMKLVMWRLLEDKILFENIRFGMSTVFTAAQTAEDSLSTIAPNQNAKRSETFHLVYKIPPYSRTNYFTNGMYYVLNDISNTVESIPNLVYWSDYGVHGTQAGTWGVYSNGFVDFQRRAWLRVPIADYDKEWTTKGGNVKMTQLERFRIWIDGIEDIAGQYYNGTNSGVLANDLHANQFDIHRNPELKVSSPVPLSQTIFPKPGGITRGNRSRSWYIQHGGVSYAKKDSIFAYKNNEQTLVNENGASNGERYTHYYKPGSGEAMGSVLDFFSPDKATFGSGSGVSFPGLGASEKFSDMIDEQFPIRNACDPNYVILFTAGDNSPADYPLAKAVENLYNHTRDNKVTILGHDDDGNRVFTEAKLDKPIKTIVVGFVDPENNTPNVVTMRNNLTAMAKAGDPDNPNAKAYFANNVPDLLSALREIMVIINNDIQPAKESMLEGDQLDGDDLEGFDPTAEITNLYAASYRINLFDQWEGTLTKYITARNTSTGEMETKADGELGARILNRREGRNLKFWNGGAGNNFADVGYTGSSTVTSQHPLAKLAGLDFDVSNPTELDASFMENNPTFVGKIHPSRAMFDWYYGYDVSYIDKKHYKRDFMLADQGRSGIVKVGAPQIVDSLPGFEKFAESHKDDQVRLYVQTNDGVLHVVDPKLEGAASGTGMREELAILPPPTLLPRRMFTLKTTKQDNGRYRWIDVNAYLENTSDDIPISSVPAYILDGPLQLRYFDMRYLSSTHDWKGLLFGSLGRGGSGLYAMVVAEKDGAPNAANAVNPHFYWYRETIESDDVYLRHIWRAQDTTPPGGEVHPAAPNDERITRDSDYWTDLYQNPDDHPYEQLGFNPPKPYFSVAEVGSDDPPTYQNLIALAGGMQNKLDLDNNGTMGAALYLVDPDVRFHGERKGGGVKVYNSGSLNGAASKWRFGSEARGVDPYMGMVNSEPVFLATRQNNYVARGVFFSDNRGSIFYITFEDPEDNTPYDSWDRWKIYTVASLHGELDDAADSYSIPWGLTGGSRGRSDKLWVGGGTANSARADPPDEDTQHLYNKSQMIFAFVMPDIADSDSDGKISVRSGWAPLSAENNTAPDSEKIKKGWYIPLQEESPQYHEEYVTMRPVLFGGNLYVATFMQEKIDPDSSGSCETSRFRGKSRLYAISLESGEPVLWNDGKAKYLEFDGIKFASFTLSEKGDTPILIIAYRVLDQAGAESSINRHVGNEDSISRVKGMDALVIKMASSGGGKSVVVSNDNVLNYWLYK